MSDIESTKPALSNLLSIVLPAAQETLLLRACLSQGPVARQAWEEWHLHRNGLGNTFIDDPGPVKPIGTFVFNALRRHGFVLDRESQTYLRSAYLHEELRSKTFRRICGDVLRLLESEAIPAIVLKGTALAETVYLSPVLRHCHDIEILVQDANLRRTASLLPSLGFSGAHYGTDREIRHLELEHESRLPVQIHTRLFESAFYDPPLAQIWQRSRQQIIAGVPARILAPGDSLVHVCGHASYSRSRQSLRWVTDAWFIIDRNPDLDWDLALNCAAQSRLALPLSVMLRYLAEHLHAPIPATFLSRLSDAAAKSDAIERQLALHGTRAAGQGSLKELLRRTTNWRERLFLIQWLFFPSPRYLCWVDEIRDSRLLPFHYVYRPIRHLGRYVWSKLRGTIRRAAVVLNRFFPLHQFTNSR